MTNQINPLLDRIRMPGSTFKLPSSAKFYTANEEVSAQAIETKEVYVAPMTTFDEITFTSPDKLLNGTAVTEVFARCIPDVKNPLALLATDVDLLVMALRIVSYGDTFPVTWTHDCVESGGKEQTVDASVDEMISRTKYLTDEQFERYQLNMSNGQVVKFRPLTYGQQLQSQQLLDKITRARQRYLVTEDDAERDKQSDTIAALAHEEYLTILSALIRQVDATDNRDHIRQWIAQLPIQLRQELLKKTESLGKWNWGPPEKAVCKCKYCNKSEEVEVDLNPVGFFTARSSQVTSN